MPLIFLLGSYILLFISLIWTDNKEAGLNKIGIESSLFLFPVFLGLNNSRYLEKQSQQRILISFVAGTIIISLFLLFRSLFFSISYDKGHLSFYPIVNHVENIFFYSNFSYIIHPTYFGMMVLFAAAICLMDIKYKFLAEKFNAVKIILALFLLLQIFLISSRAIMMALIILMVWITITFLYRKKILLTLAIIFTIIAGLLFIYNPRVNYLISTYDQSGSGELESLNERVIIWGVAFRLVEKNLLLGLGVGDVQDKLEVGYADYGYKFDTVLNCHNQFIEQWLSSGLAGLLLLLAGLIIPIFKLGPRTRAFYICFIIVTVCAFMFESTLNRLWGVAFFSIFYTLLTSKNLNYNHEPKPAKNLKTLRGSKSNL
ncbi:MAG TPA: O-antigen ligase family protein [Bacteroidales bacterium]|nr:O-antigen ligase family protein [Bacteroidales bacterium]